MITVRRGTPAASARGTAAATPESTNAVQAAVAPVGLCPRSTAGAEDCTIPYPTTQSAMNVPTWEKLHASVPSRKMGTPTTNHMSRAPKRKNRAAERTLISGVFEKSCLNPTFPFACPMSDGSVSHEPTETASNPPAIIQSAPAYPADRDRQQPTGHNPKCAGVSCGVQKKPAQKESGALKRILRAGENGDQIGRA